MWWSFSRRAYLTLVPLLLAGAALGTGDVRRDVILAVASVAVGAVVLVIELRHVRRERAAELPVHDDFS